MSAKTKRTKESFTAADKEILYDVFCLMSKVA
jgi:hypothetical protein